jgi:hypothetical protein
MRFRLNSNAHSVPKEEPRQKAFGQPNHTEFPNHLMDQWLPEETANGSHPQIQQRKNTRRQDNRTYLGSNWPGGVLNGSPAPAPAKQPVDKGLSKRFAGLRAVNFDTRLGPGPSRLYNVLDDYAGAAGTCFPHQATVAKRLGVSDRSIRRWLSELVQTGHVIPRRTGRGSHYTLAWVGLDNDRTHVSVFRSDIYVRSDRTSVAGAYKEEPYQITEGPQSSSSSSVGVGR